MSSLLGSLQATAGSMRAVERALASVQNNVANAGSPGYAKQTQSLKASRFDPSEGFPGGVESGPLLNSRSSFAEESVRNNSAAWGRASQQASDLGNIEPLFTIADGAGIPGALSNLYQSFSQLAVTPNDNSARLVVIDRAKAVARGFNSAAQSLGNASLSVDRETKSIVSQVNSIVSELREINSGIRQNSISRQDAGIDAHMHDALERLSEVADFTAIHEDDGTVSVFLARQVPLLVGERQYSLTAAPTAAQTQLIDGNGVDVAKLVSKGRLGAALEIKNKTIPALQADLDRLAAGFADRVNTVLAGGVDANGTAPAKNLFTYDPSASAATLGVSNLTPAELAAASPAAAGGNGNALNLSALAGSKQLDGYTFTEFYGNISASVGRQLSAARSDRTSSQQLLAQSRTARQQLSGVNLDEEAAHLIELQRGYQAAAKMLTVLSDLTQTLINLIR